LQLKITLGDKVLFITLIFLSLSSYVLLHKIFPSGSVVIIKVKDKTLYVLPLNKDKSVTIETSYGINTVEIKNGRVAVTDADCPQKFCIKQGWINRGSLVCLPNRLIVTVESTSTDKNGLDAITR
jgi:hypothetical protein